MYLIFLLVGSSFVVSAQGLDKKREPKKKDPFTDKVKAQVQPTRVFKTGVLEISSKKLRVEIARSPEEQQQGLMYRMGLAEDEGMLFIFESEGPLSFWMKNTFIDLDIGYFDSQKKLVDIQTMKAVKSVMEANPPSYPSKKPAKYALEVPKGWFQRNSVKLGSTFILKESTKD